MISVLAQQVKMSWRADPRIADLMANSVSDIYRQWIVEHCRGSVTFRAVLVGSSRYDVYADFAEVADATLFKLEFAERIAGDFR